MIKIKNIANTVKWYLVQSVIFKATIWKNVIKKKIGKFNNALAKTDVSFAIKSNRVNRTYVQYAKGDVYNGIFISFFNKLIN